MSVTTPPTRRTALVPRRRRLTPYRRYAPAVTIALGGYLFFGKSFAYLHVPGIPAFIGEIVLALGVVETFRGRAILRRVIAQSPALQALLAFVLLGAARLTFDIRAYGLLAVRDSAIWYYALIAMITVVALRARPEIFVHWETAYRRAIPWFLLWAPLAVVLSRALASGAPRVPDSSVSMLSFKPGDFGVQAAMALAFWWLVRPVGMTKHHRRRVWGLTAAGFVALLIAGTQNRGGLVTGLLILVGAWLYSPTKAKLFFIGASMLAALLAFAVLFDVQVALGGRELSVAQLTENVTSLLGRSDAGNLDETVEWREQLWTQAVRDVTDDSDIVTGFGFGPNIAERYGINHGAGPEEEGALRSPHNSHLSVLTRMGGIGFTLWLVVLLAWVIPMTRLALRLRRANARDAGLVAWCALSVCGLVLNANFDPTLEGPQVAIWFWTLYGIGVTLLLSQRRGRHPVNTPASDALI